MARRIENTDRKISREEWDKMFYEDIGNIAHCVIEAKNQGENTNNSEALYRKALVLTENVRTYLEAKIGNLYLRKTPGRRELKDSGMELEETSSVISQPTDDSAETGSGLCDNHVLATSMSRASFPLD